MPVKISSKGQIVLPAGLRKKYKITAGKKVDIIDFGSEIVIVSIPETMGRGFLKFKRSIIDIMAEYKEKEKKVWQKNELYP